MRFFHTVKILTDIKKNYNNIFLFCVYRSWIQPVEINLYCPGIMALHILTHLGSLQLSQTRVIVEQQTFCMHFCLV